MTTAAARSRGPLAEPVARGRLARVAFAAAPVGVLVGWTVMRLGASRNPGAGWALAHSLWLVSYALFGVIVVELYRRIRTPGRSGKTVAVLGAAVAVAGITAITGQMMVDLVIGLAASDREQMHDLFQRAFDVPGVQLVLYGFGPGLLIVGLAALAIQLAAMRRISRATAVLALAGIVLIAVESATGGAVRLLVMPAGAGCLWLALNALSRASMHAQAVLAE